MQSNRLLLSKENRNIATRSKKSKPVARLPNEWWGIDMTKVKLSYVGYVYITVIIDWFSKKLVGYHIGLQSTAADWCSALDMAVRTQFPLGIRSYQNNLSIMSDNGCQPTSRRFKEDCKALGINLAFTSYCNPKGNADTERFIRTMKEECLWINQCDSFEELENTLSSWIKNYNQKYLHSSLKYKSPIQFEKSFLQIKPISKPNLSKFITPGKQRGKEIDVPVRRGHL